MKTINLFPILLHYYDNLISEKDCQHIIFKCKKLKMKEHGELINSVSSHSHDSFLLNKFFKLKKLITIKIKEYENQLGLYNSKLDNSWVNFQYEKSKLKKHTHPNSQVSGVLYLKVDDKSSPIYFYNPNPYNVILKKKEHNINNFEFMYFYPKVGDLILFPSWLSHGSHEEESLSEERIALSFNTKL